MKRYILQDGSGVVRSARGDWVRYADIESLREAHGAAVVSQAEAVKRMEDSESQLRLCEEHAGTMAKDFDASLAVVQKERDFFASNATHYQRKCDDLEAEIIRLRIESDVRREGWANCALSAQDAWTQLLRMREFLYAYFIDGVLRFGERDGKPWTYREEARELLGSSKEILSRCHRCGHQLPPEGSGFAFCPNCEVTAMEENHPQDLPSLKGPQPL